MCKCDFILLSTTYSKNSPRGRLLMDTTACLILWKTIFDFHDKISLLLATFSEIYMYIYIYRMTEKINNFVCYYLQFCF